MAIGNYIKSNKASILYILDVLEQYSSFEHPLSVMEIKRIFLSMISLKINLTLVVFQKLD